MFRWRRREAQRPIGLVQDQHEVYLLIVKDLHAIPNVDFEEAVEVINQALVVGRR